MMCNMSFAYDIYTSLYFEPTVLTSMMWHTEKWTVCGRECSEKKIRCYQWSTRLDSQWNLSCFARFWKVQTDNTCENNDHYRPWLWDGRVDQKSGTTGCKNGSPAVMTLACTYLNGSHSIQISFSYWANYTGMFFSKTILQEGKEIMAKNIVRWKKQTWGQVLFTALMHTFWHTKHF